MPVTADPKKTIPALTLTATADITVVAAADGQAAPLPRFKMVAYTGGAMRVAGWRHPVVIDLAGLAVPSQARPIRFGHDPLSGVGHTDSIRVEAGQLVATGVISRDTSAAKEVVASSRNGFPWQASVGASVEEFEFIKDNQKATVNGQELTGPVNVVRKATLGEISFVDLGADGRTSASIAARQNKEPSVMADDPTTSNPTPSPIIATEQTPEQVRAAALAETARIAAVRKVCGGKHSEIEAQAIRDNWDATRTELEVLRASRPKAPAIHAPDTSVTSEVLEAACFQSAKLEGIEKVCSTQAIEIAAKRFQGGLGLQELLFEAAIANGYTGRTFRDSRRVLEAAFGRGIEAGMTTIDVGGILSNVANKFLLEGFFSVERVWRSICAVRNVSDFKTVTSYRLVGKDQYEQVAPGGELKQGTLGEETYTNKADTYGLMLSIDRRDIINDDLGAITTVPPQAGPWLGPENQRRLLDGVHEQRRVLQRRQQELRLGCGHRPWHRRPHQGRGRIHGPCGLRRQAHGRDARDPAGAHGALGDGHAALQERRAPGHDREHQVPRRQPAPGQVPHRGQPLPVQRALHRQLGQGVVPPG